MISSLVTESISAHPPKVPTYTQGSACVVESRLCGCDGSSRAVCIRFAEWHSNIIPSSVSLSLSVLRGPLHPWASRSSIEYHFTIYARVLGISRLGSSSISHALALEILYIYI